MDKDFFTLTTPRFTIEGRSRAGHETWFRVRDLGVMLDIGRGPDAAVGVSNVFVTHAHLDHAVGIPFYAGQRQLHGIPGGRIWVPAAAAEGFRDMLGTWERLTNARHHGSSHIGDWNGVAPGERRHSSSHSGHSRSSSCGLSMSMRGGF